MVTAPTRTHTHDEVTDALNWAADAIEEAADLPDAGIRDALNLLVNATAERLDSPDMSLTEVAANYGVEENELAHYPHVPPNERALAVILGWIGEA